MPGCLTTDKFSSPKNTELKCFSIKEKLHGHFSPQINIMPNREVVPMTQDFFLNQFLLLFNWKFLNVKKNTIMGDRMRLKVAYDWPVFETRSMYIGIIILFFI